MGIELTPEDREQLLSAVVATVADAYGRYREVPGRREPSLTAALLVDMFGYTTKSYSWLSRERKIDAIQNALDVAVRHGLLAASMGYGPSGREARLYEPGPAVQSNPFEQPEPPDAEYDPHELREGTKVEMEHTTDRRIAKRIAKDHLDENKSYYRKLATLGLNPPGWTRGQRQLIEDALAAGLLVQEDAGRVMILTGRSRNAVGLVLDETGVAFRTDVPLKIATAIRTLKEMRRVLGLPGGR